MDVTLIIYQLRFSLILYIFFAIIALKKTADNFIFTNSKLINWYFYLLVLLVIVYCQGGDYWSYRIWFLDPLVRAEDNHIELVYRILTNISPRNFFLFRLLIWGSGVYLFKDICRKYNIDEVCALSLFGILYTEHYAYARASLGIIIAVWAFLEYVNRPVKCGRLFYLKILSIAIFSLMLHKSILGLWCIFFVSCFIKFNKTSLILLLILYQPLTTFFHHTILNFFIDFSESKNYGYNINYISGNFVERNISGMLRIYSSQLLLLAYTILMLIKQKIPSNIERVIMATIMILYVASMFLTLKMGNSNTTAMRFFVMAFPTGILSCAYAIQKNYLNKNVLLIILLWGAFYSARMFLNNILDPSYIHYTYLRSINAIINR